MNKKTKVFKIRNDVNDLADMIKSIAHPERLQILNLMCNSGSAGPGRLSVKNIYETLKLEQSIVSRHLGIMKRGGFLKKEVEGRKTYYCLNEKSPAYTCALRLFIK